MVIGTHPGGTGAGTFNTGHAYQGWGVADSWVDHTIPRGIAPIGRSGWGHHVLFTPAVFPSAVGPGLLLQM